MDYNNSFSVVEDSLLVDQRRTGAIRRQIRPNFENLPSNFQQVVNRINNGDRVCVLLRGLPGSGKSYLANAIINATVKSNPQNHIISADSYFIQNGRYKYDASKLSQAHDYAQRIFVQRASEGYSPLIVDNTNKEIWEMFHYVNVAIQYEYYIEIMIPNTPWAWSTTKLAMKNIHMVPIEKINFMKEKFEKDVTIEKIANALRCQLVKQPKKRNIPPYQTQSLSTATNDIIDLNSFNKSLDINKNMFVQQSSISKITEVNAASVATNSSIQNPLNWNAFQQQQLQQTKAFDNLFAEVKHAEQKIDDNSIWSPQEQIFNDTWEQPEEEKLVEEKSKDDTLPQPQRKQQRKNKKSASSPPDLKSIPHRRYCRNENPSFANLCELYSNVKDSQLWDLFVKTNHDAEWCANLLCDDDKSLENASKSFDDLTCDCDSNDSFENNSSQAKKVKENEIKKQTPIKTKKNKNKQQSDEQLATKLALEENIRIDQSFYPDHVNQIKSCKNGSQERPSLSSIETVLIPPIETQDDSDNHLIELPIHNNLIYELDDVFGGGLLGTFDKSKKFRERCLIKKSTAQQLFKDIMENVYSQMEEERLRKIQEDHYFALQLHEQEKIQKYPRLAQGSSNSFKDIMETQEALRSYENDTRGEWQTIEKPETIACKLNKEKLYAAFPSVEKSEIDNLFEAYNRNFKEAVRVLKDSLMLTAEERKNVDLQIKSTVKIREKSVDHENDSDNQEEISEADTNNMIRAEDLQVEIKYHSEEFNRLKEMARAAAARKEFDTSAYYNSMASLQKQYADEKRHDFVNLLVELQRRKMSNMLDLHYFKISEAKVHLHNFLDYHISRLREMKKPYIDLEIITGRGAHSQNGLANIKMMTIKLLHDDRKLKPTTVENNAGILKVKVHMNSPLYNELDYDA
ncbi:hypothetical protein PVAND_002621 [Polypedilum vanderplanki]|uniref:Smr domain-containing protein n=1 Tax=Polypedilum vanderplanki TaxID=319348 RepID=A0A9J6BRJ4_POLVA|nr:hypothetical protein PVAND_002621 [Polypedilum vanderplanki]